MNTEELREAKRIRRERRARGEYKLSTEARAKKSGENHPMWGKTHTDATKAKIGKAGRGKIHTEVTKAKMSKAQAGEKNHNYGKHPTDEARARMSETRSGENHPRGMLGKTHTDGVCKKIGESNRKTWLDKQWYGTVTYILGRIYCILFNAEFKERCRAYWGYKSVLEPHKTQADNICGGKPYKLTVHHVYYQPKACCEWDEDLQGYYAMINLGTQRKPNRVRHNIKGDPNKFVILTHSENIKANSNKLEWIKYFENLIEEQGGKCYLTKEEMIEYKKSPVQVTRIHREVSNERN